MLPPDEQRSEREPVAKSQPDVEAWLFDARKKVREARDQIIAGANWIKDGTDVSIDIAEHHVRLAQGKLAIARVDLAAARAAIARYPGVLPPASSPETGEQSPAKPGEDDLAGDWA